VIELVVRRAFFDDYAESIGKLPPSLAAYCLRFTCPCCGYPTLGRRGLDEICFLCWWEDDGQDDHDADVVGRGPNAGYSLTLARANFAEYSLMYEPWNDRRVGGPDSVGVIAIKQRVTAALEAMRECRPPEHEAHWAVVREGERELGRMLKRNLAK
jgi:hypothetical protein